MLEDFDNNFEIVTDILNRESLENEKKSLSQE